VVQTSGAPPAGRTRRRRRLRRAEPDSEVAEVPLTRLTVIRADGIDAREAARELERLARDRDAADDSVAAALRVVNGVLRAHRIATLDPYGHGLSRDATLAARIGYGTGDALAEGRWEEALEVPQPDRHRRRAEALRPSERLAAVLAGRERIDVCEALLLRARADLDEDRPREAALQLRLGLEALLAEVEATPSSDQGKDLALLEERRGKVVAAAEDALHGALGANRAADVAEALAVCERVLRRRQIRRQ
jgi:hypothetical protein